jgi:hypothetical protein
MAICKMGSKFVTLGSKVIFLGGNIFIFLSSKITFLAAKVGSRNYFFGLQVGLPIFEIRNKGHFKGLAPWPRAPLGPLLHQSYRFLTINENQ